MQWGLPMSGSDEGAGKAMATRPLTIALATAALTWLSAAPAWATITIQLENADANGGALTGGDRSDERELLGHIRGL